jgi:aminopeptidase N
MKTKYLSDYTPYPYLIDRVELRVELDPGRTRVTSRMQITRNPAASAFDSPLELNGEHLELIGVALNGSKLDGSQYIHDDKLLIIKRVPESFELEIITQIAPEQNTALEGLYLSSGNYCTQCEAEGFRRITCYPDRPDVMAVFTTTVIGDRLTCPVLLANGNLVDSGDLDNDRHFATWHDPFPKPGYLFALVAGNLVRIEDGFTTMSGREVALHIFVQERNRSKCAHAMESLKKAMRWDEEKFGREYDLDTYMIVAVDDFNMGAMENKGLNIFNSRYVLARPETATDTDYEGIEGVIAHEYFHNWTGNRITCRDWFQLSLKEGLTVFRDQEFSADMGSRAVKRIYDVNVMRSYQFREDAGPMAHPVRPESYVEINNFYTLTVYNKGAEVIRMMQTLLGVAGFRRGMDLYFERHDGQAVTCDDFVRAMEDANDVDLTRFKRWYSQSGTPELTVSQHYDETAKQFRFTVSQSCPPTPGQKEKKPFYLPLDFGLLDSRGHDMKCVPQAGTGPADNVLILDRAEQEYCFCNVQERPVLSLLRNFSAPVKMNSGQSDQDLAFLMAHDSDPFNRWDAGQQLAMKYLLEQIHRFRSGRDILVPVLFHRSFAQLLADDAADPAFTATSLVLPAETWLSQQMDVIDPDAVFSVRQGFCYQLFREHRNLFVRRYTGLASDDPYRFSAAEAGRRALRNRCLAYLLTTEPGREIEQKFLEIGLEQYENADNMTDVSAALAAVVYADRAAGDDLLADFYARWKDDPLVVDKWLTLQATCILPGTLDRVKRLLSHPSFSMKNPNKVRSLIGSFCGNQQQFHALDGSGYTFLADRIMELDPVNPQVASRLVTPLTMWKRYDAVRQVLMKKELERITTLPSLSGDVGEIVEKSLA